MVAATAPDFTLPDFAATDNVNNNERPHRAWTPERTDHLVFQWVKMEGKSQGWVAAQLEISQSTVSRIIQRYERWQAHRREREGGRLDHSERLRAQRWLTFERNEVLLASCLRIAGEMEGFTDVSKSTIHRGNSLNDERNVVTQHSTIDRSGVAARFLRLAFRINMEQLKLAELDPLPPPEPLSAEEIADELRDAAAAAEEFAKVRRRSEQHHQEEEGETEGETGRQGDEVTGGSDAPNPQAPAASGSQAPAGEPTTSRLPPRPLPAEPSQEQVPAAAAPLHNVHQLHNDDVPAIAATAAGPCSCGIHHDEEKKCATCITAPSPPPLVFKLTPDTRVSLDALPTG